MATATGDMGTGRKGVSEKVAFNSRVLGWWEKEYSRQRNSRQEPACSIERTKWGAIRLSTEGGRERKMREFEEETRR